MSTTITADFKMGGISGFRQHGRRIAADGHGATRFKEMMIIQLPAMPIIRQRAQIGGRLTIILATIL